MARKAGIPLVDLFDLTDQINSVLPQAIQDFINRFAIIDHHSTRSPGAIVHHGQLQALNDSLDNPIPELDINANVFNLNVGIGTLALPLVHGGLPFQLSMLRQTITNNLEPASDAWQFNLFLSDFILTLDGLEPAILVPESGTTPRHLLRDPANGKVRILGAATLRISKAAGSPDVDFSFIDHPDPLDPTLDSGAVATLNFSPPSFFLGPSDFGMTVGQLQFDFSDSYSPSYVLEHNQGTEWVGLAIRVATVFAPRNLPVLGDISGGVRDVLLGKPLGVQGEFELQFGRTALDPATFQFLQGPDRTPRTISGAGVSRRVIIEGSQDEDITMHTGFTAPAPPADGSLPAGALQDWTAIWAWDGEPAEEADSSSATIRHASRLVVQPVEIVTVNGTETRFNHPEITFRFDAAGDAPSVTATAGTESFAEILHIGGTASEIGALTLAAVSTAPGTSEFTWEIKSKNTKKTGTSFTPDVTDLTGRHTLTLTEKTIGDDKNRVTRIMLLVLSEGDLLIGTQDGVFNAGDDSISLALSAVENTYDLSDFHAKGALNTKGVQATLDPAIAAKVAVPADGLAQVTISDGFVPDVEHDRHVQILMKFGEDTVSKWGYHKPAKNAGGAASEADLQIQLLIWASHYPGAEFLIIGRCDDIGKLTANELPDSFNIDLAKSRADKGRRLLATLSQGSTGSLIDTAVIYSRGETTDWIAGSEDGDTKEDDADIALTEAEKSEAITVALKFNGWLIKNEHSEHTTWENSLDRAHTYYDTREQYRRVDIYAVGGAPTQDAIISTGEPERSSVLRRSMVPANDRSPAEIPPSAPAMDYRVKLVIRWDSPTVANIKDAIPTLAEAEFAWTPEQLPLPQVDGDDVELSREVLTVYAKWIHDTDTGFTRTTLGLRSDGDPNGLVFTENKILTAALAFGPALLSGVDLEDDVIGSGARMAALLTIAIGGGGWLVQDGSKSALIAVEAEAQTRSIADPLEDYQIKLVTEYTCTIHVDSGVLGIRTKSDRPMKIRYKNVGIEFDNSKEDWEKVGMAFDTSSMEIEDSGQWEINGVLGDLLRIVEITFGRGSIWVEGRIAVAMNIGVIEISEAIIRLIFEDGNPIPRFELRGFVLKADIPNVLSGEGRLRIEDGGIIRAGIDASIIPLGLAANGALALAKPPEITPDVFLSLHLGVQFSTPVPLAQSGAALYGFKGMFTMNGVRDVPANPDPIGRELDWWALPPEQKYAPESGQYAIGVGVVVGTMPDVSFCFSASGMVVVAFPDPEVILGVDVKIIEVPDKTVSDEGAPEGTITGLIVIDDEAVKVAVSAQYDIPKVLSLKVPFGAYFPYSGNGVYIRLGSDGVTATLSDGTSVTRHGEPITLTLLPGTLDAKAWAYLMIEQAGLPMLGGDARFSFDGFSVGFGAGWGIEWKAGPIELSASAKVLVGFGTNPLMIKGGVFVEGELDLVVLSISARGELILTYLGNDIYLDGEFCGEVDMFFFSLKGCVGVHIGGDIDFDPPEPEAPLVAVSLVDRKDQIMGEAVPEGDAIAAKALFDIDENGNNNGASPDENNTVWPDTAPVLHFSHYIANALPAGNQFDTDPTPSQPKWFGGNRLKYAYQLNDLTLRRKAGNELVTGDAALQTVWMDSPYRQPNSSGLDNPLPSEHEGPNLKLLDWNPWTWVVNMDDGGENSDGDPSDQVEDICDPVPQPRHACVFGRAAQGLGWYSVRLAQETLAPPPYPSRFYATAEPVIRSGTQRIVKQDLQNLLSGFGGSVIPGQIKNLPFAIPHAGETLLQGYGLPYGRRAVAEGIETIVLPWEAQFDRELASPRLTLLICDSPGNPVEGKKECTEFEGVKADGKHTSLVHKDLEIRALDQTHPFTQTDVVNTGPDPDQPGQDLKTDIFFPEAGIEILFVTPCRQVELHFMKFTNADIELTGIGPGGQTVASSIVSGPQSAPLPARLNAADGISRVFVKGGGGEAVLYRICCIADERGEPRPKPEHDCETFLTLKPNRRRVRNISHEGFVFTPLQRRETLLRSDAVDQSGAKPVPGQDRSAEIMFPDSGMKITLDHACESVEVWVMQFANKAVSAKGLNAQGAKIASASAPAAQRKPHRLVLRSVTGEKITHVVVAGGSGEAVVFRICCLGEKDPRIDCITFAGLRPFVSPVSSFAHAGKRFTDLSRQDHLRLQDGVNAARAPVRPGSDRVMDLSFSNKGLRIELDKPCQSVTVHLMLFAGPVKAQSLNSLGGRTDTTSTTAEQRVEQILNFRGPDINVIELFGGAAEALLYKICCTTAALGRRPLPLGTPFGPPIHFPRATSPTRTVPVVRGIIGDDLADTWIGKVVAERGGSGQVCKVVEYTPAPGQKGPWNGVQLVSPKGFDVTLLSICGIDQVMVDQQAEDQDARDDLLDDLTGTGSIDPSERREILLEPGQIYEVEITWSWQAWQSNKEGSDAPPSTPNGPWIPATETQVFEFAVADEDTNTGSTQDGLNEFVFDARDVSRHLYRVEPEDGRAVHFTDDPLWAHFDAGHMQDLLEQYGRELEIEVKRTDPPPQSNPADLITALEPLLGEITWMNVPRDLLPLGYQRINDAVLGAPCLPDAPVVGGASLAAIFDLDPNAMYDFNIITPRINGSEPLVVSATRFTTSRYANPTELITDLGYKITGQSPYPPEDIILPIGAVLPGGAMETSDSLMDDLLTEMDAGTLPLPGQSAVSYAVWRQDGSSWLLEGLLIDSLETLSRHGAVATATGSEITTRCALEKARIGGRNFTVHRTNENWTRVFLKANTAVSLSPGKQPLRLDFTTSDGTVSGTRTINHQPAILEREGF